MTVMSCAMTSGWWPLLLPGAWRHLARRIPLRYDVEHWSLVFPLGMYTVATIRLADAIGWPLLRSLAGVTGAAALVAWVLTFAALLRLPLRRHIDQPGRG
jgi:tellurite resistance protein TehA-like permease